MNIDHIDTDRKSSVSVKCKLPQKGLHMEVAFYYLHASPNSSLGAHVLLSPITGLIRVVLTF